MKQQLILLLIMLTSIMSNSQNKSGNNVIFGGGGMVAQFTDTSLPTTRLFFPNKHEAWFSKGSSCISDSANGNPILLCNGMQLYDTLGNIVEDGDSLVPSKIYDYNPFPVSGLPQTSIMLPKGSNGKYYVIVCTTTDTNFDPSKFNLLQYHVVDMNANGGMGKVVQKNIPILENEIVSKVGMQAVRHANGYDWWLLKQSLYTNIVYSFLITKDTIVLDTTMQFNVPIFGKYDLAGQSAFSKDGTKYAYASGGGYYQNKGAQLFIADFDRCYGTLGNVQVLQVPYDSSLSPLDAQWDAMDSLITGIAFSENNRFLYVNRRYNIYQYDLWESNPANAWYHVQYGIDNVFTSFLEYGIMLRAIDGRIYIGQHGGSNGTKIKTINKPNEKGSACDYCTNCLQFQGVYFPADAPSNMPDFNLGAIPLCFPLSLPNPPKEGVFEVFPNPSSTIFEVRGSMKGSKKELYNSVGQLVLSTKENEIDVRNLPKGLYYLKCEGVSKKVIVE
jgi:hypothetical protein